MIQTIHFIIPNWISQTHHQQRILQELISMSIYHTAPLYSLSRDLEDPSNITRLTFINIGIAKNNVTSLHITYDTDGKKHKIYSIQNCKN